MKGQSTTSLEKAKRKDSENTIAQKKRNKLLEKMKKKKQAALNVQKEAIGGGLIEIEDNKNNDEIIICQHCSEPISSTEDYILFGELHYLNLRGQAKLNLLSELLTDQNCYSDEESFNYLRNTRNILKKETDPTFEPFIRACGHVAHKDCLELIATSTENKLKS